jgi:hypothetical protein
MAESTLIASVRSKLVLVSGTQQTGWLPAQAGQPADTPLREMRFSFELQFDGYGYLLCYSSSDGSLYADTWHASQSEAEQVALEAFGVESHEWQRA